MTLNHPNPDGATPDTVVLRGMDELEFDDNPGVGTIRPGMLLEREDNTVQPHSTDGGAAAPRFAVERGEFGMLADDTTTVPYEASNGIVHDEYVDGETVWHAAFDKGQRVWGLLAPGEVVSATGDSRVVSDGAGGVRAIDTDGTAPDDSAGVVVAEAVEDVDNSGGTEYVRVRLEVTT